MTRIAICADDYALSPGIDEAIRRLAGAGRITATSCMTVFPSWPGQAQKLRDMMGVIDIGLHLTLTDHAPIWEMPMIAPSGRLPNLKRLYWLGLTRALERDELIAEINRQIDAFEGVLGRKPDFLDGHHHVHQFPGIRDAVIEVVAARLASSGTYMRSCWDNPWRISRRSVHVAKALAIALPGWRLSAMAVRSGISINQGFSGVYDFSDNLDYGVLFGRFISCQRDGGLVMCHPALADGQLSALDLVVESREREYHWLASDQMKGVLEDAQVELCRLSEFLNDFSQSCSETNSVMENVISHDHEIDDET